MAESSIFDLKGNTALYEVLGVSQTATQREIRQAYYRLAVVYHPDKNPEGGDVFKEVSFAHGILSDPEQRAMYDSGTLRKDLEGKARAYDPSMDPDVELSPESLRAFVDRVRQAQEANRQTLTAFEQRREEEMRRRAEYDAKNPVFRAEYERARRLRQRGFGAGASPTTPSDVAATKPRTSAEILAELQRKEDERVQGLHAKSSSASASGADKASGLSYKMQLMAQYRAMHTDDYSTKVDGAVQNSATLPVSSRPHQSSLRFVQEQSKTAKYSEGVDERIQAFSNFDYRSYVEEGRADRSEVEEAIMADALGQYDRNN